ncbi:Uncharacterised protein [uncultured archaeon]|nr:Uncharacterised protein [uncultured archaeon]
MKLDKVFVFIMIFLLGFFSANLLSFYLVYGLEKPFPSLGFASVENHAPSDFIHENQVEVYPDKIIINVDGASISRYAPTGSMKPTLDENSNGIRIIPKSEKDIHLGDIITFEQDNSLIIHRVIEIGNDQNGTYFITKGDNNSINDGKIRFKNIRYLTVGILW